MEDIIQILSKNNLSKSLNSLNDFQVEKRKIFNHQEQKNENPKMKKHLKFYLNKNVNFIFIFFNSSNIIFNFNFF